MLENARLGSTGQQPELRNNLQRIPRKDHTLLSFNRPADDTVKIALFFVWQLDLDGYFLAQQLLECHLGLVFCQYLELEAK